MTFDEIVNTVVDKCREKLPKLVSDDIFQAGKYLKCPDEVRGCCFINESEISYDPEGKASEEGKPKIIIVLESPHINEFGHGNQPIGPAQRQTGKGIIDALEEVLKIALYGKVINGGCYDVLITNAIQYQTSLGKKDTLLFRDLIFIAFWLAQGKNEFCSRLVGYFADGDIVINACTAGSHNGALKPILANGRYTIKNIADLFQIEVENLPRNTKLNKLVESALKETLANRRYYYIQANHPSVWKKKVKNVYV